MIIFFEILKVLFFVFSVIMGLFFLRGYYYLPDKSFTALSNILMPAYLLMAGLMIGYVFILFQRAKNGEADSHIPRVKGFIWGLILGVVFGLLYIFYG